MGARSAVAQRERQPRQRDGEKAAVRLQRYTAGAAKINPDSGASDRQAAAVRGQRPGGGDSSCGSALA